TETVGMITEIKTGHGRVELRSGSDWRRAGPLQALRAGDALRVTDDAVAVVMLRGGGTVKVQAANSPYTVAARADDTRTQKARTLVQAGLGFMAAGQREAPTAVLSTRSAAKPPVVIAPRNTSLLPGPIALEWAGSRFARYTVRIVGPSGPVFERRGVAGGRPDYPADGPARAPGRRCTRPWGASTRRAASASWLPSPSTRRSSCLPATQSSRAAVGGFLDTPRAPR